MPRAPVIHSTQQNFWGSCFSPNICQVFFFPWGRHCLLPPQYPFPLFSFLRELRICSRRQRAELKCPPSQKPLQGSHTTRFLSVRWRGKVSRDSREGFCFPEVDSTTFLLLFYPGCEVAVSLEGEQPSYDHRTTHKRRRCTYCRLPSARLISWEKSSFSFFKALLVCCKQLNAILMDILFFSKKGLRNQSSQPYLKQCDSRKRVGFGMRQIYEFQLFHLVS